MIFGRPPVAEDWHRPLLVYGDFVCPWSYLTVRMAERLADEFETVPYWRPHLLHPEVPLEGMAFSDEERLSATRQWLREVAPGETADMRFPDRLQSSMLAFEGLEYAYDHGAGWAFLHAVFDSLWKNGRNIAERETLEAAAEEAGLDAADLCSAVEQGAYRQRLADAVGQARRIAVTATPTLILGRTRVNGWHYFEVLHKVMADQYPVEKGRA
jgi:predicted DsbA family dithiol-disulfide isomerase